MINSQQNKRLVFLVEEDWSSHVQMMQISKTLYTPKQNLTSGTFHLFFLCE
jgi:hypothetical protein